MTSSTSVRLSLSTIFLVGISISGLFGSQDLEIGNDPPSRGASIRNGEIQRTLLEISRGKFPPDKDARLISLIQQEIAGFGKTTDEEATADLEAAARGAQEAVSEVTVAYTAAIFRTRSVQAAKNIFARFKNTIDKIVEFARIDVETIE